VDYHNIMVAVDNSDYSTHGIDIGIEIAQNLNLEAGFDYASIGKDNAAYANTVDNNIMLLVARLQLEY